MKTTTIRRSHVDPATPAYPMGASNAAQEELNWFFEWARESIDVPTNYPAMMRRLNCKWRTRDTYEVDDRQEERDAALHSARIIHDRLKTLHPRDLDVIRMLFGHEERPQWLDDECGFLAPVVLSLAGAESDAARAEADGSLRDLVNRAHGVAARALAAYEATRAGFSRSVVPERTWW